MNAYYVVAALIFAAAAGAEAVAELPDNPLLKRLVEDGVRLQRQVSVSLPPPTLHDGLDPSEQRNVVTEVAGRHGWSRFTRDSAVTPFALDVRSIEDADGKRIGHAVDFSFAAYASLENMSDEKLLRDLIQAEAKQNPEQGRAEELDQAMLAKRGIPSLADEHLQERFIYGEFPLMGSVHVGGVGHGVVSRTDESILVAWQLDERFATDDPLGSRWRPIVTDDLGRRELGPAHAYRGYGGYGKITSLAEPQGAVFIECHVVFHEPDDWFTGSNLLRSKLPVLIQEGIRKFRRRLSTAEETRSGAMP